MHVMVIPAIVGGAVGTYAVIRARLYTQTLFAIALVGAIAFVIAGIELLSDLQDANDTAAAILVVGGLGLILGCAFAAKFLFSARPPSI